MTSPSRRLSRTEAGRDVVSASERLMDDLLAEEDRCFTRMADGLAVIASDLAARLKARERTGGAGGVNRGVEGLLPTLPRFEELLLPPVGDLLATVRERTLVVVRRQLQAGEATLARNYAGIASRAATLAKQQGSRLESHWYQRAAEGLERTVLATRADLVAQADVWWTRKEPVDLLVQRWCQPDPVYLVGAHSRGAVWLVRHQMNAHARNSAVALANGLTLAGITGWNTQVDAATA